MRAPGYGARMSRFIPVPAAVLAVVALLTVAAPASAGGNPGIISVSAPLIVKVDAGGTPQASAVLHAVYRSGYDGGALNVRVRESGTRLVADAYLPSWTQPCEPEPSYRCVSRLRLRDLRRVEGRTFRRNRLYVVESGFESFAAGGAFTLDPGFRIAVFWTV